MDWGQEKAHLSTPNSAHFLCGANRPDTHAHTEAVNTSTDETKSLGAGHYVAPNELPAIARRRHAVASRQAR